MGVTPILTWDRPAGRLTTNLLIPGGETKSIYGEVPAKDIPEGS